MSLMPGPITIEIVVNGAHDTEAIAKLMVIVRTTTEKMLDTKDVEISLDYGRNN